MIIKFLLNLFTKNRPGPVDYATWNFAQNLQTK